jgi:hypothetical protein
MGNERVAIVSQLNIMNGTHGCHLNAELVFHYSVFFEIAWIDILVTKCAALVPES